MLPEPFFGGRRAAEWFRSGLSTTAAQILVQGLGFAAGILVIRFLPPRQYAFYTIATAGLGMMTVLTDGGVSGSMLALGGAVWMDRAKLGRVIATGLALRGRFAGAALFVAVPLIGFLVHRQGGSWLESAAVPASLVPLFLATVSGQLLEIVPRLHQALPSVQGLQVRANASRAALLVLSLTALPYAWIALLVASAPQWWSNLRLRKLADRWADWREPGEPEIRARVRAQLRRTMPDAFYYAFSGQLATWLISFFGHEQGVATVGALGRLAMILTVFGTAFNVVAVPRFARVPSIEPRRVRRRYIQAQLALVAVCTVTVLAIAAFPGAAVALLGHHYAGSQHEAVLMSLCSALAVLGAAAFQLGAARGTVAPPAIAIPCMAVGQLLAIALLPLRTVSGVIWIGIVNALIQWTLYVVYFLYRHQPAATGAD
ncbi:MAG TPA: hypothetical protein VMU67_00650 [Steroidobacteraceae bacterium]|nr:hypothetical protein [Steroidobacteraceae bacterium]